MKKPTKEEKEFIEAVERWYKNQISGYPLPVIIWGL